MDLLQKIAENLGATGPVGASWMQTIAIEEGATGPVGGSWIQAWADAVGVTGPLGGSWIQALADHYGVTGGDGDWLIGIEANTAIPPLDPDVQAFITAAEITNPTQISALENLVTQLKTASLWTNMQALYPFVGGSASSHKYNLKDPRDLDVAGRLEYRNSAVTHDANGISFIGTGYASTWCVPGTSVYDRSYGEYIREAFNDGWSGSTTPPYNAYLGFKVNTFPAVTGIGVNNLAAFGAGMTYGYLTTSILSDSEGYLFNNSSVLFTQTNPLVTPALGVIYLGTANLGTEGDSTPYSEWANRTLSFAHLGNGLTPAQHTTLASIVQTYQTALGRNV
jgi:hypothetical protein